jgi:hypothetical protein
MKEYGILKAGSIIVIAPPFGRRGRNESYEIVSFDKNINEDFNMYLAYKLNANRDKVIGAKTSIRFPKSDKYLTKSGYSYNYWLAKEGNGELVFSKDLEDSLLIQQGTGTLLKYEGEKPTYLMTREEYKTYMKPIWEKVFDLPKKYPQYFYKKYNNIETSEEKIFNIDNDFWLKRNIEEWKRDNKVEPKKPIPAELKKALKEDFEYIREITFKVYVDENLKTNNKPIISKALQDGIYAELIKKGQLNTLALKEILDSVKLKLPAKLEKKQAEVSIDGLTYEKEIQNKENLKKFEQDIISYFKEYYDKIQEDYIDKKTETINKFIDFSKNKNTYRDTNSLYADFSDYLKIGYKKEYNERYKTTSYTFSGYIISFFSTKGLFHSRNTLVSNWEEIIVKLAKEEADYIFSLYVGNLIQQIPLNIMFVYPKLISGEITDYSPTGFDSELKLEFDNGFRLDVKNKTIYAGGYNIQQLHLRTIFHFSINGKVRSDEEIQKAYKEFVPVKEKEVVSASSDKEYLESKLIASQDLLEVLDATQGDEKDIEYVKNMIEVTKDLISLL